MLVFPLGLEEFLFVFGLWRFEYLRQIVTQLLFSFCFRGEGHESPLNIRRRRLGEGLIPSETERKREKNQSNGNAHTFQSSVEIPADCLVIMKYY